MTDASAIILFEGGLDMVTPVQGSSAGTLVDCLNYEVGPIKGYKRIDGYERFDNFPGGGVSNLYRTYLIIEGREVAVGTYIYSELGLILGVVAEVIDADSGECLYIPARPGASLMPGKSYLAAAYNEDLAPAHVVTVAEDWRDVASSPQAYSSQIIDAANEMRGMVRTAPRPVAGVHYGRTEAFAAVDCIELDVSSASPSVQEGQFIVVNGDFARVLKINEGVAQIHPIGGRANMSSGVYTASLQNILDGVVGSPISGTFVPSDTGYEGSYSAGLYRLPSPNSGANPNRGYTPVYTGTVLRYINATAPFGDTVTVTDGTISMEQAVVNFSVESGDFANGDASGVIYLAAPTNPSPSWNGVLDNTYEIHGEDGKLADVSVVYVPDLAGTGRLRGRETSTAPHTHYMWGTYNFLSTTDRFMSFAVTGKSRAAFVSDEGGVAFWSNIITEEDSDGDRPKYLSFHSGQRLALGFANGIVRLSAVGTPLNFSGLDGAVEIGTGDSITGMLEAFGDSTVVFGARSIRRITGSGGNLELKTISSSAGAFDYTAASVAGAFLYVNQNGVCSLDQTSAYGDFSNSAVSGAVDPWLTPRVIQDASSFELGGTVCAFPVRDKNQYRLFLGDGNVLNMSVTPEGIQPTISNYALVEGSLRVPLAWDSSVSDEGYEYVLVVWDRVKAEEGVRGVVEDLPADNIIYRLDHGWGFDGVTFPHYIETAYLFNEDPTFFSITKAVLYGMGYGSSTVRLRASGIEDDFNQPFNTTVQDISLPRNPAILYKTLDRVMGIVDHANWGRGIKLRFENITPAGEDSIEPHHILQSVRLFLQTEGVNE